MTSLISACLELANAVKHFEECKKILAIANKFNDKYLTGQAFALLNKSRARVITCRKNVDRVIDSLLN